MFDLDREVGLWRERQERTSSLAAAELDELEDHLRARVNLNARIRDWRQRQERETALSPRELDELEDHLRARVDLEMELNPVLAPEQAFAIARRNLGEPVALSREFAKAGRPRWRRWLLAGWAMYGASWFLPVIDSPVYGIFQGYEIQLAWAGVGGWPGAILLFSNLAMLLTVPVLWRAPVCAKRWFWRSVGAVGAAWIVSLTPGWVLGSILSGDMSELLPPLFTVGFWTWTGSYICVAAALRLRAKDGASAAVRAVDGFDDGSPPGRPPRCNRRSSGIVSNKGALQ